MENNIVDEVINLRNQGLTDNLIATELKNQGYNPQEITQALAQKDFSSAEELGPMQSPVNQSFSTLPQQPAGGDENVYERIEEIAESIIDEKWDELISEVKKIVDWKEKMEEKQNRISNDLQKLKEDFKVLHQGVLGKLEDYDNRMRDVSTELGAVGKVFKDVIPEFVENVKELKSLTGKAKGIKEE